MKCPHCNKEIKNPIAQAGGFKSRRKITPEQQKKMQEARKKKNAISNNTRKLS